MKDWAPDLYLQFANERTQPSIDLVNRIKTEWKVESILDIGCGPGNSSQILFGRWPEAHFLGIDNSEAMIGKAEKTFPDKKWLMADAARFESDRRYDIVFSNATIQWIPDHEKLLYSFSKLLTERGILAFQIPLYNEMAISRIIDHTAKLSQWSEKSAHCSALFTYHDHNFYYNQLSDRFSKLDIWETHYYHIMKSHTAIIDFMKSTGLKPYLECIDSEEERNRFLEEILFDLIKAYPAQKNGSVLFPFKRLFVIAAK